MQGCECEEREGITLSLPTTAFKRAHFAILPTYVYV